MNETVGAIFAIIIVFAVIFALVMISRNVSRETEKEAEKSDEERILHSLQKIEKHTFGIKIGIFLIIIYAFVLPVILRNL